MATQNINKKSIFFVNKLNRYIERMKEKSNNNSDNTELLELKYKMFYMVQEQIKNKLIKTFDIINIHDDNLITTPQNFTTMEFDKLVDEIIMMFYHVKF